MCNQKKIRVTLTTLHEMPIKVKQIYIHPECHYRSSQRDRMIVQSQANTAIIVIMSKIQQLQVAYSKKRKLINVVFFNLALEINTGKRLQQIDH